LVERNLQKFEEFLASAAECILVFVESPGSFAETGLFVKGGVKLDQRGGGKLDHLRKISGVDGAMGRDSWSGGLWSGLPDRV
jgi:hypothetical protein